MNKRVVTIAREFGSGGREIGLKLAETLNVPFYDKNLLKEVAESGGMHEDFIAENEERSPMIAAPLFGRNMLATYYQPSFSDTIFIEQAKLIKSIAERGPCVIVGRCADYVLRDDPDVVKVFISASMEFKISRKQSIAPEKADYSDAEMEKYIKDVSKQRIRYYEHYTGMKKGMASNFDLCIRTDKVGTDGAVKLILDYLENLK
ncbi:MAG: cytidylate kinase-like family protein [Firmicutes bacterium]|nr:cytidylate kinase-like family protein [Bacillota bacterium]